MHLCKHRFAGFQQAGTRTCFLLAILSTLLLFSLAAGAQNSTLQYLQSTDGSIIKLSQSESQKKTKEQNGKSEFQQTLEINGSRIPLPKNEWYIGNTGNVIFTKIESTGIGGDQQKFLYSYTLNGTKLTKTGSQAVPDLGYMVYPATDNTNILISDEYEGLGIELSLYDANLKKLYSYKPLGEYGFDHSLHSQKGNKIVFVFFPLQKQIAARLVMMDLVSGHVDFETPLTSGEYTISSIRLIGDYTFLCRHKTTSEQELLCFDGKGNLLWKKDQYLYLLDGIRKNGEWLAFAMDKQQYWFIDPKTGAGTVPQSLKSIIGKEVIDKTILIDIASDYTASSISVLVSTQGASKAAESVHEVYKISSPDALPVKLKTMRSASAYASFVKLPSRMLVLNSDNQILYSYEN